MSYRIEKKERVSDGIRRIAAEEIHATVAELGSVPLEGENIHEARRHLKKLHALLRLLRKQFSSASFKRENQTFRAAGRMLSPIRDARVIDKALASLKSSIGKTKPGFRFLATALRKECDRREMPKAEIAKITKSLQSARGRIKNWPLIKLDNSEVRAALERSFRRCGKRFEKGIKEKMTRLSTIGASELKIWSITCACLNWRGAKRQSAFGTRSSAWIMFSAKTMT